MDKKSNKRRKIQKNKFFKEKTNDVKKRKNYVTSMKIPMYLLGEEILKKANINLKNSIKLVRIIHKKTLIENILKYNVIEAKEVKKL